MQKQYTSRSTANKSSKKWPKHDIQLGNAGKNSRFFTHFGFSTKYWPFTFLCYAKCILYNDKINANCNNLFENGLYIEGSILFSRGF